MKYIDFIIFYLLSIGFVGFVYYFNVPFIGINLVLPTAFCVIGYIIIQKKWYKILVITIFCCISIIGSILLYETLLEWKLSTLGIDDIYAIFSPEETEGRTEEQRKYMTILMNDIGRSLAKRCALPISFFLSFFGFLISKIILKLRNNKKNNSIES